MTAPAPVKLPKSLRAEWMDVLALDRRVTPIAYKIAGVLGSHFSRHKAETFIKNATIAKKTGLGERTVWRAINLLERLGYVIVDRREFGTVRRKRKDGTAIQVRLAGGRGVANVYQPAVESSPLGATFQGGKLAARCDLFWEERSPLDARKVAAGGDPTLSYTSYKNPGQVYIHREDERFDAWNEHRRRTEGKSYPTDKTGGWHFPSDWPPDHQQHSNVTPLHAARKR